MKYRISILSILVSVLVAAVLLPAAADWDVKSDMWVATDALGRTLPGYTQCGPPRSNRTVGIFYFEWLGLYNLGGPYDITKILAANPTNPQWGPAYSFHHWGESELGYYRSDDEFAIRKHCQMLNDAGIDVMIFDATNGDPYTSIYTKICQIFQGIRNAGGKTPQICFFCPWAENSLVQTLYNQFYSKNLYPDLWFQWLGKPLILSAPDGLSPTVQAFFTFRHTWAWSSGVDNWSWIDYYPQIYSYHTPGVPEEISVSIAQQYPPHSGAFSTGTGHGRNWHDGAQPPQSQWDYYGHNFAEQWRQALAVDPPFVFVTGWNEWVAQRLFDESGNTKFVDTYTQEYSRDIEPMKDGHTDCYYYQLVDNVRRYKGVRAPEAPSSAKTITIDGSFADWDDVSPTYRDYPNDTMQRNSIGWDGVLNYVNTTGRNDFTAAKAARDSQYVYFYAETKDSITTRTGQYWMLLFINSDCNQSTGWNGYDYLVNSPVVDDNFTTLKRTTGGWNWTTVRSDIAYKVSGNKMEIRIPRAAIGLGAGSDLTADFHWADNIQKPDDIIEFSVSGDSAPNRRFDYRYNTPVSPPGDFAATPGPGRITLSWTNPSDSDLARVVVRYKTSGYPTSDTDGATVVDKTAVPGATEVFQHSSSGGVAYYYAAYAYDGTPSTSQPAIASATPGCFAVWLNEAFDGYLNGDLGGQGLWTTTGAASAQVQSSHAESDKAALLDPIAAGGVAVANELAFEEKNAGYYYFSLDVSQDATGVVGQEIGYVSFQTLTGEEIARLHVQRNRLLMEHAAGSAVLSTSAANATWYRVKAGFNVDSRSMDLWVDTTSKGTGLIWKGIGTTFARVVIGSDRNTTLNPQKMYVDNLIGEAKPLQAAQVLDDGAWTPSAAKLHFSFDPVPCAGEYRYSIGTTSGGTQTRPWTSCGTATDVVATGLSLSESPTYYVSVQAGTGYGTFGASRTSDGIKVAPSLARIPDAKALADGTTSPVKSLRGKLVSVPFSGYFYIQEPGGPFGLKVVSTASVSSGDQVDVCGVMKGAGAERYLDATGNGVIKTPGPGGPYPAAFANPTLGGSTLNPYTPGVVGGFGPNNIGLYAAICGRVTQRQTIAPMYFYIDDGSGLKDGTATGGVENMGIRVIADPTSFAEGSYVVVKGVVSCFDSSGLRRLILPESIQIVRFP